MKITSPLSFCTQASPPPSFPSVHFCFLKREVFSIILCRPIINLQLQDEGGDLIEERTRLPCELLITKSFSTWCNVLQVHFPPSQLLPIRGNLGKLEGNWRTLLILLLRLMQMLMRKTPSSSASHHNQIQLCTCHFGGRGRWEVGDGCR